MGYDNRCVFTVNAGSNEVASLKKTSDYGLELIEFYPSGGVAPVSLASYKKGLYVVNALEGGSIQGYYVREKGMLAPIDDINVHFDDPVAGNIEFGPDGKYLIVSEKNINNLTIFLIDANGRLDEPYKQESTGPTPFGASFTTDGILW